MRFQVANDNRAGSISAKAGRGDARGDDYNIDPSKRYVKITRTMEERAGNGTGQIGAKVETTSDFVGYSKDTHECDALTFRSVGTITLPKDAAAEATGTVQDSVAMGFRVASACRVRLVASAISDSDIAEVRLKGGSIDKRIFDDFDEVIDLPPGEYSLRGAYQLNVRVPNSSLGGRPITVEMEAKLTPA